MECFINVATKLVLGTVGWQCAADAATPVWHVELQDYAQVEESTLCKGNGFHVLVDHTYPSERFLRLRL